jgi:hypothetical protein
MGRFCNKLLESCYDMASTVLNPEIQFPEDLKECISKAQEQTGNRQAPQGANKEYSYRGQDDSYRDGREKGSIWEIETIGRWLASCQ